MFDFKFDWNPSLSVGIPEIDEQHQELFKIGREIEQCLLTQCSKLEKDDILAILCKVREYVTYHFYEEEKYIEAFNKEALSAHKREHKVITARVNEIDYEALINEPNEGFRELKLLLQKIVFEHILTLDTKDLITK